MSRYLMLLKTVLLLLMLIAQLEVGYNFGLTSRGIGPFLVSIGASAIFLGAFMLISAALDAIVGRGEQVDERMVLSRLKGEVEQVTSPVAPTPEPMPVQEAPAVVALTEEPAPPSLLAERHTLRAMRAGRGSALQEDQPQVEVAQPPVVLPEPVALAAMIGLTEGFDEAEPQSAAPAAMKAPRSTSRRKPAAKTSVLTAQAPTAQAS